ncbi:hypothetical protein SAMN05660880_04116, partial [Luteibacter sp. 22Crub2.1]
PARSLPPSRSGRTRISRLPRRRSHRSASTSHAGCPGHGRSRSPPYRSIGRPPRPRRQGVDGSVDSFEPTDRHHHDHRDNDDCRQRAAMPTTRRRRRRRRRRNRRQPPRRAPRDLRAVVRLVRCCVVLVRLHFRDRQILADRQLGIAADRVGLSDDVPEARVAVDRLRDRLERIATLHHIARGRAAGERGDLGQYIRRACFVVVRDLRAIDVDVVLVLEAGARRGALVDRRAVGRAVAALDDLAVGVKGERRN